MNTTNTNALSLRELIRVTAFDCLPIDQPKRIADRLSMAVADAVMTALAQTSGEAVSIAGAPEPAIMDVTLDDEASALLCDTITGGDADRENWMAVRFLFGAGHAGFGLYVASADYPSEGAILLRECTPAAPQAQALVALTAENEKLGLYEDTSQAQAAEPASGELAILRDRLRRQRAELKRLNCWRDQSAKRFGRTFEALVDGSSVGQFRDLGAATKSVETAYQQGKCAEVFELCRLPMSWGFKAGMGEWLKQRASLTRMVATQAPQDASPQASPKAAEVGSSRPLPMGGAPETKPNPQPDGGYPGCDMCICPTGYCDQNSPRRDLSNWSIKREPRGVIALRKRGTAQPWRYSEGDAVHSLLSDLLATPQAPSAAEPANPQASSETQVREALRNLMLVLGQALADGWVFEPKLGPPMDAAIAALSPASKAGAQPPTQQATSDAPTPPELRLWYMRENHTFRRLSTDLDQAVKQIQEEFANENTFGALFTEDVSVASANLRGKDTDPEPAVRAWYAAIRAASDAPAGARGQHHGLDSDEMVCFYEQDFYVLSNFSSFNLQREGLTFPTSEHAYHWEKFCVNGAGWEQLEVASEILDASSAHEAYKIAERNKGLRRKDWDDVKVRIMREIIRAKAEQHEYVRRKLLATGDRLLVENSWRDDYWGWGPNRDGQNMLGNLWMEIRAELRAAPQEPKA